MRKDWEKQERRIAKEIGGQVSAASGALSRKGDVRNDVMLVEAKTTGKSQYTVRAKELEKIWREALIDGRLAVLVFDLNGRSYGVLEWNDVKALVDGDACQ